MPDEAEAADAFGVLSDPTRIAILRAFAEALDDAELGIDDPMPELAFSEIYDRVEVDSTPQLSYHLEQLGGTYLRQTEDGWQFTFAGEAIVRLFLSEAYTGEVDFEPIESESACPICGADALDVVVEELALFRECSACGRCIGSVPVTPAQVEGRDEESLLASARTRMISHFWRFREDVCTECGGAVDVEFHDLSGADGQFEWMALGRCRQCWRSVNGPPSVWLVTHPASVAFHWDHGVDVFSIGLPEFDERIAADDWRTERVDTDEYVVTYRVDDAELRLTVDDELAVLGTERVRRDSVPGS